MIFWQRPASSKEFFSASLPATRPGLTGNISVPQHLNIPAAHLKEEFLLLRNPGVELRSIIDQEAPDQEPEEAEHSEEIEDGGPAESLT